MLVNCHPTEKTSRNMAETVLPCVTDDFTSPAAESRPLQMEELLTFSTTEKSGNLTET